MMARRKIVMLVAGLVALCGILAVGLGGCKDLTFNGDMKGYLEYWTGTVQMGRVDITNVTLQKNDAGVDTLPLSATATITGYIINPKQYALVSEIGDSGDTQKSVRVSDTGVKGLARVSASDPTMIAVSLDPATGTVAEHTTFTLSFTPVRSETGVGAPGSMAVTLQYNTPPRAPLALMWDSSNSAFVQLQSQAWQPTTGTGTDKDGYIYWGWPEDSYVGSNSFDETAADCVAQFSINGTLHDASNLLVKDSNGSVESFISGSAPYDVYGLQVGSGISVSLFAQDSEGIAGTSLRSGVAPYTITLLGNGGQYNGADTHQLYLQGGSTITKDDLAIFQKQGYKISGWRDSNGAISFPYTVKNDVTLTAQWTAITYTVSYDLNEGTGDVPDPSTVTLGSSVTVGQGSLTRVGYIFNGWNTQKNGQGDKYTQGQQFTPKADTTLYAQWQVGAIINSADEAQAAINEALVAAQDGDEILIKLGANLTGNTVQGGAVIDVLSIDTTKDVSITIDGGGHTINANGNGRGLRVDAKNATVTVKNITLTGANHNTDGGGIFFLDGKQLILDSGTIITGNTLTGNNSHGGGIYVGNSNATVIIKDNVTISDNEAVNGGGLCLSGSKSTVVMEGGTFSDNTARGNGGAVYIGDNPSTGGTVRFTMKDGVFNGTNSATKGGNHIAVDQGMQETTFVFHKDIGGKSTTRDGHSMIEVYTAHTATGYTSYVTDSKWEGDGGLKMGDLK